MLIKSVKYDQTSGGMSCSGPVWGDPLVEVMVSDEGKSSFIHIAAPEFGFDIRVSSMSIIDVFAHAADEEMYVEEEMEKIDALTTEHYFLGYGEDVPEEIGASKNADAIKFAFMAIKAMLNGDEDGVENFIKEYRGVELEEIDLSEISIDDEDEEY